MTEENLFDKMGLEVKTGEVEIGQTYPVYGMITNILQETPGDVIVVVNFQMKLHMSVPEPSKIETLKERFFEPGIFVSTFHTKNENFTRLGEKEEPTMDTVFPYEGSCSTVVFGRKQEYNA